MINSISGKWYPKDSSVQYAAQLTVAKTRYEVKIVSSETGNDSERHQNITGQWSQVTINDRLGNTERKLTLTDGSLFTTHNNDAIDTIINSNKNSDTASKWRLRLHRHETKMTSVLTMLVITVVFVFSFIKWGIPWTSQTVAHALPQQTGEFIGHQSLDFMDRYFLKPTQISGTEQQQIISRFKTRLKPFGGDENIQYRLHFRDMSIGGSSLPNAFALPSGDIILTDKFVELSQNDDEIDAVLLHEMGHVVERHSLEMLTQNSLTTMIVILVLGNPDGISELATGLGTALVSNHYSRQYETEADEFAFNKMLEIGIDPKAFGDILSRMEEYSTTVSATTDVDDATHEHDDDEKVDNEKAEEVEGEKLSDFLSTHPNTQLRIKMAEKYSKCFEQGLKVCE
ncbi:M48 family metallopeptidase [Psychrobacter okhotskensis]|uniref:M48 family metallopeptidase n=1 Tax=Psychrobacter okhotskensis TaxID=212403 RepID=UPI003D09049C